MLLSVLRSMILRIVVLFLFVASAGQAVGAEPIRMRPPTTDLIQSIEKILGTDFVKGEGAFPPGLLVATPDINKDGIPDLVVEQKGFCNNHSCTYVFVERTVAGWEILLELDSWGTPYLVEKAGSNLPPDIIGFDHLTNDCMQCSPPQPVRYIWRKDLFSPGGRQGSYTYVGATKGFSLPTIDIKATDEKQCDAPLFLQPVAQTNILSQIELGRQNGIWTFAVYVESKRKLSNISVDVDGSKYPAEMKPDSNDRIALVFGEQHALIDKLVGNMRVGSLLTLEVSLLGRVHTAQYKLGGAASEIAKMPPNCWL